jgi:hypothetical protein
MSCNDANWGSVSGCAVRLSRAFEIRLRVGEWQARFGDRAEARTRYLSPSDALPMVGVLEVALLHSRRALH